MTSSFSNLSLAEPLARAVAEMGYESMTPIQAQAIPVVLTGQDVMGAAQTGTGKTAAFSLPLLQRLLKHENSSASPARHPVRALVLLPTRELADQVAQQIALYAKYTKLRSTVVFGGMDMKPQTLELKKGVEVLVATPGRLLDHIEAKNAVLNQVEYVVLDEADRMLDIGFLPDLQRILQLPAQAAHHAVVLGHLLARNQASGRQLPARPGHHRGGASQRDRLHGGAALLQRGRRRQAPRHPPGAARRAASSRPSSSSTASSAVAAWRAAWSARACKTAALHGDKSQDERLKALEAFKQGEVDLLVCTDVAARGLDIEDVPAVFNFDVPFNAEDYVHRIGRTGPCWRLRPGRDAGVGQRCAPGGRHRKAAQNQAQRRNAGATMTRAPNAPAAAPAKAAATGAKRASVRAPCASRTPRALRRFSAACGIARRFPPPLWPRAIRSSRSPTRPPPPAALAQWEVRRSAQQCAVCRPTSSPSARWRRCSNR